MTGSLIVRAVVAVVAFVAVYSAVTLSFSVSRTLDGVSETASIFHAIDFEDHVYVSCLAPDLGPILQDTQE